MDLLTIHGHTATVHPDLRVTCDCGWSDPTRFTTESDATAHWARGHALPLAEATPPDWLLIKSDILREQVEEMIHSRPTTALRLLAEIEAWHRPLTRAAVNASRDAGASWTDIGDALGVSRQAAHERFSG